MVPQRQPTNYMTEILRIQMTTEIVMVSKKTRHLIAATGGGKDLRGTHKTLLRLSLTLIRTLTAMMISWERQCMMRNT
uniref:Uncharacterized protein n=1 Tax=Arundo donax TaxID=35708 RepID=A0A0A9CG41_ARUDO